MKNSACITISEDNCTANHHCDRPTNFISKDLAVIINKLASAPQVTLITLNQVVSASQWDSLIGNCGCQAKKM